MGLREVRRGIDMRRSLIVAAMAALLLIASLAPAGATPPSDVEIEVPSFVAGTGTFVATGPAVDDEVVCGEGDTNDLSGTVGGNGPWGFNLWVIKEFTCDDGSGSFLVSLHARVFNEGPIQTSFNWVVIGGDGDYTNLHGSGKGFGLPSTVADVDDVYTGKMHSN
jgi:hypothetical protein